MGEGSALWKVEGEGCLRVGAEQIKVRTSAEADAPQASLMLVGAVVEGWRSADDRSLIVKGEPRFLGSRDGGPQRYLAKNEVELRLRGARYGERLCTWSSGGEMLARLRYLSLPEATRLELSEVGPGALCLTVDGLPPGLHARLSAGCAEAISRLDGRTSTLRLEVPGMPPGEVRLRLWSAQTGGALTLMAPWPARAGMILDPDGRRLTQNHPLAVDELRGWRAVCPQKADLEFNLSGANHRSRLQWRARSRWWPIFP